MPRSLAPEQWLPAAPDRSMQCQWTDAEAKVDGGRTIYGVVEHHGLWPQVAEAIRRYEGWRLSGAAAEKRVRQALYGTAPRKFDFGWALIVIRVVTAEAGPGAADAILGAVHEAEYAGRREYEGALERSGPMRVRPGGATRRAG